MSHFGFALLAAQAFWRLISYDLASCTLGFEHIYKGVIRCSVVPSTSEPNVASLVSEAVAVAACFYWKPVLCLQRSVVATELLRKWGVRASLVIGYRPYPFLSHAWVEVDGFVVGDSDAYKERLKIICRV
jgi:hypothetical protein